jgi:hypothetical protein
MLSGLGGTDDFELAYPRSLSQRYALWWWGHGRRLLEPLAVRWDWVPRAYGWWLKIVVWRVREVRRYLRHRLHR